MTEAIPFTPHIQPTYFSNCIVFINRIARGNGKPRNNPRGTRISAAVKRESVEKKENNGVRKKLMSRVKMNTITAVIEIVRASLCLIHELSRLPTPVPNNNENNNTERAYTGWPRYRVNF